MKKILIFLLFLVGSVIFAENLENDLEFKNIGYAFVTGMLGYVDAKKGNREGTEEDKNEK